VTASVPPGFTEMEAGLGFTDVLRPLYRREGKPPAVGILVHEGHTNLMDICHGGVIMTLADVGAAWAVNSERGEVLPAPTLNLSFDFISAARLGEWLQVDVDRVTVKRRVGFASGVIATRDALVCRFSGSFYFPEPGRFEVNPDRFAALEASSGQSPSG